MRVETRNRRQFLFGFSWELQLGVLQFKLGFTQKWFFWPNYLFQCCVYFGYKFHNATDSQQTPEDKE